MKRAFMRLTIGELARRPGIGQSTVRYYERAGVLPQPGRTAANYRLYADDAVTRLRFIRRAQQLGFTLNEIKGLLDLRVSRRMVPQYPLAGRFLDLAILNPRKIDVEV